MHNIPIMKVLIHSLSLGLLLFLLPYQGEAQVKLLYNHIGYETLAPIPGIILTSAKDRESA